MMSEILAMKLVRSFASSKLQLAIVLTTSWNPIIGALPEIVEDVTHALGGDEEDLDDPTSALEVSYSNQLVFLHGELPSNHLLDGHCDESKIFPGLYRGTDHR